MPTFVAGLHHANLIDNVGPFDNFAENTVTNSVSRFRLIEEAVIRSVDEELAGRTVGDIGPSHGHRILDVLQTILRFVFDSGSRLFLTHIGGHPAPLDHEAVDHAMKNRPVIMTILRVLKKIGNGNRRLLGIETQGDIAEGGFNGDQNKLSCGETKKG